jgi:hypothetical protein
MIRLKEGPDPLTEASWKAKPLLAECEAGEVLYRELLRYARRETAGRSLLIAGHRGAGKTTLVRQAVQKAQQAAARGEARLWPLLISLHGPDLLHAADADRPRGQGTAAGPTESPASPAKIADGNGDNGNPAAAAMRILAKHLHRALADELAAAFRDHVTSSLTDRPDGSDLLELVSRVEHELDHAADLATLREFWRRSEALEFGVMAARRRTSESESRPRTPGQGARELIAVGTAIEAFRIVSGTETNKDKRSDDEARAQAWTAGAKLSGKDIIRPALGALTGGVFGAGLVASHVAPWLSALGAITAALGSALAFDFNTSGSRTVGFNVAREFTWDTSIASLDRMLPVLVERMLGAGLAPIFVVDELDKVAALDKVMGALIDHLKHFVTEKAFFCFLSDRPYFEQIDQSGRAGQYSKEFTFFSDRLFVHYTPRDLRKYIEAVLTIEAAPNAQTNPEEERDRALLGYLVLQASRLSPIALRRELGRYTNARGDYTLPPAEIRERLGSQMRGFMQLAIEHVLGARSDQTAPTVGGIESDLVRRMKQDGKFSRLACDALYYPSVRWATGDSEWSTSEESLVEYLEARLNGDGESAVPSDTPGLTTRLTIRDGDRKVLVKIFAELLGYLRDPARLRGVTEKLDAFNEKKIGAFFVDVAPGKARWLLDPYGLAIGPVSPTAAAADPPVVSTPASGPIVIEPVLEALGVEKPTAAAVEARPEGTQRDAGAGSAALHSVVLRPDEHAPSAIPGAEAKEGATSLVERSLESDMAEAQRRARWIESLQEHLEAVVAGISLDALANSFRLLDIYPAWTNVVASVQRVLSPRARPEECAGDAVVLQEYAKMLFDNCEVLRYGLVLALAGADEPLKGFALVRDLFGFGVASRDACTEDLYQVCRSDEVRSWFPATFAATPGDPITWLSSLRHERGLVDRARSEVRAWAPTAAKAAERWTRFLNETPFGFEARYPVTIDEYVLASTGRPHLRAFVDSMTLGELWLLAEGDHNLGKAVRMFLGLGTSVRARQERSGEKVLLGYQPVSPIMSTWLPSRLHTVFPFALKLADQVRADWPATLVLLECHSEEEKRALPLVAKTLLGNNPKLADVPVLAVGTAAADGPLPSLTLLSSTLDHAVSIATRLPPERKFGLWRQ